MKDYHGCEITAIEKPDTQITVWEITPSLDYSYDSCVIRDYYDAGKYATQVLESIMDDPDRDFPATITIGHCQMSLADYEEICEKES